MIAGQALDLAATRREVDPATLETVHRAKTGALLEASVVLGASIADAGDQAIATIRSLGGAIGLAFQIVDDILDETAPVSSLGKTPGKDRAQGKATYPGVYGMERSREFVRELTSEARLSAERLGSRGALLGELATALADRMR
jgi:geranylgeranyl pyrophosphate synthase